ncbi:hypothetical protein PVAP13_6KG198306 [Panicum virgatum]|uniref:Uncharacterized protein n=1 Tax=Panicum virgatum TaxID=38727 RepID=A0A8T0RCP8_PANVG|nr:hypothetical protein PVAP13_6KG198306 [Panicum virgatum]
MATAAVAAAAFEAAARRWRCGRPGAAQEPEAEGAGSRAAANGGVRTRGGAGGRHGDRGPPLPRRRGPGVAVEEAEARRGVGAETEAWRGGGAEAEWRPAAAAAAKSIWAEARVESEREWPGLLYIYRGATLVLGRGYARY